MNHMVENITINSVDELYTQYSRFALSYELSDNPLVGLTRWIPRKSTYYCIVPKNKTKMAYDIMNKLSGRKSLKQVEVLKDEIKHSAFHPTDEMIIYYF